MFQVRCQIDIYQNACKTASEMFIRLQDMFPRSLADILHIYLCCLGSWDPWWMVEICGYWTMFFLLSTSAFVLISVALTEFCTEFECFSQDLTEMLFILRQIRLLSSLYLPALWITVSLDREQPAAPAEQINILRRVAQTSSADSFCFRHDDNTVHSVFQTEKQPFFDWMCIVMTSPDTSKPKICGQFVAITKICELWQNLRSLLELEINSAIAESQNPGGLL